MQRLVEMQQAVAAIMARAHLGESSLPPTAGATPRGLARRPQSAKTNGVPIDRDAIVAAPRFGYFYWPGRPASTFGVFAKNPLGVLM